MHYMVLIASEQWAYNRQVVAEDDSSLMKLPRTIALSIIFGQILLSGLIIKMPMAAASEQKHQSFNFKEGTISTATLIAGPFDLHRRYRSMEGPYVSFDFCPDDVISPTEVRVPEEFITFVEGNNSAPSMMNSSLTNRSSNTQAKMVQSALAPAQTISTTANQTPFINENKKARTLLWLKGVKLEVLDENDKPLPTAEFICHWNLDVNPQYRNQIFPGASKCQTVRLITLTQGQTEITFPDGYGVPVASDETWNAVFQAANRTTDEHRRIKHRCTLYFIKDSDLVYPITALSWYAPWIYVVIDKNWPQIAVSEKTNCPSCIGLSMGVNAPNNTANGVFNDRNGRVLSGHWVIPTGKHTFTATINDEMEPGFNAKQRVVHAVWSHVHPLCTNFSLYECEGDSRKKIFSTSAKTRTDHGLEIERIGYFSSPKGFVLPANAHYELQVTYNNTTNTAQDSMATAGIFFEDPTFSRPAWVLASKQGHACSVGKPRIDEISTDKQ